jgi:lipopolysaccharide/colanic/teichoic acid biosynthesis glycosyltransferase
MRSLTSLLVDLCLVLAATCCAVLIRDNFDIGAERLGALAPYFCITLAVASVVLFATGISRSLWQFSSIRDYWRIVAATAFVVASAVPIGFFVNRLDGVARALPILQGLLIVTFLVGARVITRALHAQRTRPAPASARRTATVLLIGVTKLTDLYLQCLAESNSSSVRIAGLLDEGGRTGLSVHSYPVLGTPEHVADTLRYLEVRGVFVDRIVTITPRNRLSSAAQRALEDIRKSTAIGVEYLAESLGIGSEISEPIDVARQPAELAETSPLAGTLALTLHAISYQRIKRAVDVIGSACLFIVLAPLVTLVSALVAADIGFPLIFWQERPGLNGRPFKLYKFRTMGDAHDFDGRRIADGDRLSPVGKFLRRTRLDELPQLFNILKGDMSFVGPRPLLPVDQPMDGTARLLVRPGLTGWAQIKGGRQISAMDKAALDLWYVRNMSFALDLEILLGTVPMVLFGDRIRETAIVDAWRDSNIAADDVMDRPVQEIAG